MVQGTTLLVDLYLPPQQPTKRYNLQHYFVSSLLPLHKRARSSVILPPLLFIIGSYVHYLNSIPVAHMPCVQKLPLAAFLQSILFLFLLCHINVACGLHVVTPSSTSGNRRAFVQKTVSVAVPFLLGSNVASAESIGPITQSMKVTPIAHTFVSSATTDKVAVKPLRENDATRFFTNARVVHVFYDGDDSKAEKVFKEVLDLTVKRKNGEGAGVTPGTVHILCDGSCDAYNDIDGLSVSNKSLKGLLGDIGTGDVVLIPPKKSGGTVTNAKIVEATGSELNLSVGGQKSGGVISLLLNGPRDSETLVVSDGRYSTSTILWYGI